MDIYSIENMEYVKTYGICEDWNHWWSMMMEHEGL